MLARTKDYSSSDVFTVFEDSVLLGCDSASLVRIECWKGRYRSDPCTLTILDLVCRVHHCLIISNV